MLASPPDVHVHGWLLSELHRRASLVLGLRLGSVFHKCSSCNGVRYAD